MLNFLKMCFHWFLDREPPPPPKDTSPISESTVDSSDAGINTYPSASTYGTDVITQKVHLVKSLFDTVLVPTSHELAMRVRLKKLIEVQPIAVENPFICRAKTVDSYLKLGVSSDVIAHMFPNLVRIKFTYAITTFEERSMFLNHSANYFRLAEEASLQGNEGFFFCLLFSHLNEAEGKVIRAGMVKDAIIMEINIPDMSLESSTMLNFAEVIIAGHFTEEPDHLTKAQNYIRPVSKKPSSWNEVAQQSAQKTKPFPLNNQG